MKIFKEGFKGCLLFLFKILINIFLLLEKMLEKLPISSAHFAFSGRELLLHKIDNDSRKVINKKVDFSLYTPNQTCLMRKESFFTKEPEMLEWIEKYGGDGAFYDIGANIGIYSIYFAKAKQGNVYSFEPSVFNLRQLAKNISLNSLSKRITIIPNPLSNFTGVAPFINSNTDEGGAMNAYGVNYGHDGEEIENQVEYSVLGFSLDDLIIQGIINEKPTIIKIDVDGIEDLILSGAKKTLAAKSCKSVYIEVNENFTELASNTKSFLEEAGFSFIEKRNTDKLSKSKSFGATYNQIWVKNS
jgi:FkbM family methyltransferase